MRDYEEKSYYEIQLDNKQLILVFLAGITVCVLIFILGVMVGKGKKEAEFASITRTQPVPINSTLESDQVEPQEITPTKEDGELTRREKKMRKAQRDKTAPAKQDEYAVLSELDKTDRKETPLTKQPETAKKEKETAKTPVPVSSPEGPDDEPIAPPVAKTAEPVEKKAEEVKEETEPETGRYTVQVMATASRSKADEQMAVLKTKGYSAFLHEDKTQGGSVYKVRVGKFEDPDSARKIATRLKQDLKLETWVALLD